MQKSMPRDAYAPAFPSRFHSLDAARGLAALAVVFWHWQNFFLDERGMPQGGFEIESQPLFAILRPLYVAGNTAVDLFFALSGFVFFMLYAHSVAKGEISAWRFFVLRFSRLYPLHLAALVIVAIGQWVHFVTTNQSFVYQHNDGWHFGLHLFLLSSVGLEQGHGFNAPAWSVSVEAVLYLIFFLGCRWLGVKNWTLLAMSLFGFFVLSKIYLPLGRGVGSFYAGACVYVLYRSIMRGANLRRWTIGACTLSCALWLATLGVIYAGIDPQESQALSLLRWKFPVLILFPVTLLALALGETLIPRLGARLSWLGDISYSSYLLHFPLQLACALLVHQLGLGTEVYRSTLALAGFFTVLVALSLLSYYRFERPLQDWLRRRQAGV